MTSRVLDFEVRTSTSPYVERVWRARSDRGGAFTSIAAANVEIVVTRGARVTVSLRGPESVASQAACPPETTWLGVRLRVGVASATAGLLRRDAWVEAVASGACVVDERTAIRTLQRRFAGVAGITRRAFLQIERARFAAHLLRSGHDVADTVFLAGFVDQAHMGRAFGRYVGATPAAVRRGDGPLSLLYKTDARPWLQTAA